MRIKTLATQDGAGRAVDEILITDDVFVAAPDTDDPQNPYLQGRNELAALVVGGALAYIEANRTRISRECVIYTAERSHREPSELVSFVPDNFTNAPLFCFKGINRSQMEFGIEDRCNFRKLTPVLRITENQIVLYLAEDACLEGSCASGLKDLIPDDFFAGYRSARTVAPRAAMKQIRGCSQLPENLEPLVTANHGSLTLQEHASLSRLLDELSFQNFWLEFPLRHQMPLFPMPRLEIPLNYRTLKKLTRDYFRLNVEESNLGCTTSGRIGVKHACDEEIEFTIQISKSQSDALKYLALAHELAHVRLHLPLLAVEKMTEGAQELLNAFDESEELRGFREFQADVYGSLFLMNEFEMYTLPRDDDSRIWERVQQFIVPEGRCRLDIVEKAERANQYLEGKYYWNVFFHPAESHPHRWYRALKWRQQNNEFAEMTKQNHIMPAVSNPLILAAFLADGEFSEELCKTHQLDGEEFEWEWESLLRSEAGVKVTQMKWDQQEQLLEEHLESDEPATEARASDEPNLWDEP